MSEGAYQAMCETEAEAETPPGMWRTREGLVIAIISMTELHLDNTIAYLKRKSLTGWPKYAELIAERKRRGPR